MMGCCCCRIQGGRARECARRVVLLEEPDRGLWHGEQIQEGTELVKSALRRGVAGA